MKANHDEVKRYLTFARGQIDGIMKMVDDDRYCIDISHQLLAVISMMKKANQLVLKAHLKTCVKETLDDDAENKIQEIIGVMDKLNNLN